MKTKSNHALERPGETFDLNSVQVAGVVRKIWPRNGDVYVRLRISRRGQLVEEDDAQAVYANLRFPMGQVKDKPITLQAGDVIRVWGYLTHNEYFETIHRFLQAAHAENFLNGVPSQDLTDWQSVAFRRVNLMLNVRGLAWLQPDGKTAACPQFVEKDDETASADNEALNRVTLEGIVARQWEYAGHVFMRLAVYDQFSPLERGNGEGNRGRPRRKPHYITVRFSDGKVAGRPVAARLKDRLRITGALGEQATKVTLHQVLVETGREPVIALLERLPDAGQTHEIETQQESIHVEALALVAYSGRPESNIN